MEDNQQQEQQPMENQENQQKELVEQPLSKKNSTSSKIPDTQNKSNEQAPQILKAESNQQSQIGNQNKENIQSENQQQSQIDQDKIADADNQKDQDLQNEQIPIIQTNKLENSNRFFNELEFTDQQDSILKKFDEGYITQYNRAKRERKELQNNEQMLDNRIKLLKLEEIRTLKKIEETRKKALEIYYLKKSNEEKQQEKLKKLEEDKKKQQKIEIEKQMAKKEHQLLLTRLGEIKKQSASAVKLVSIENQQKIEQRKKQFQDIYKQKSQVIKQQKMEGKLRGKEIEDLKKQSVRQFLIKKKEQECQQKQKQEQEIRKMENLESELIQRLQQTQMMQKTAFEELESALTLPPKDFAAKYLKSMNLSHGSRTQKSEQLLDL